MLHAKCYMQNATYKMLHAKCYMQNATCKMLHAKCYMQNDTCKMLQAKCYMLQHDGASYLCLFYPPSLQRPAMPRTGLKV